MINNEEKIKEQLSALIFKPKNPFVVALTGEWGVGKTYFWTEFNKYLKEKEKRVAYISLFGHESLQSIENQILLQIAPNNKKFLWMKEKTKDLNIPIYSGILNVALGLLEAKDFKNVIVCFDDFERISPKLDIKDIMGLISNLKEQKECQVILIANTEELIRNDMLNSKNFHGTFMVDKKEYKANFVLDGSKTLETYKLFEEKILDYKFKYQVDTQGNFDKIKDKIVFFEPEKVLEYFKTMQLVNIRVMTRIINTFGNFKFLEKETISEEIKNELLEKVIEIMYIHAQYSFNTKQDFEKITDRKDKDKEVEIIKSKLKQGSIMMDEEFTIILINFIENSYLDEIMLRECIKIKEQEQKNGRYIVQAKFLNVLEQYRFDFSMTQVEYKQKILQLIDEHICIVVKSIGWENLLFYSSLFENANECKIKFIEALKHFIDEIFSRDADMKEGYFDKQILSTIIEYDPEIKEYYEKKREEIAKTNTQTLESILILFNNIDENNSLATKSLEYLAFVQVEQYKEYIVKDQKFAEATFNFIRYNSSFGDNSFSIICRNIKKAYKLIAEANNEYKIKITELCRILEIDINKIGF